MIKKLVPICLISILISISGCSSFFSYSKRIPETSLIVNEIDIPKLNVPMPAAIKWEVFKWIVITPDNQEEIWKQLMNSNTENVLFGITPDDYENMSLNLKNIEGFYLKQREIIKQYQNYYEPKTKPLKKK